MIALFLLLAAPELRYDVKHTGKTLEVSLSIDAAAWGADAHALCTGIGRAGRAVVKIEKIAPLPEDGDCFGPLEHSTLSVRYVVSLAKLADIANDPDYAMGDPFRGAHIASDLAFLLRPQSVTADTLAHITIAGPHETSWPKEGDAYVIDADQLFGGSYVMFAPPKHTKTLPPLVYGDKEVRLVRYRPDAGPSDAALRAWVADGSAALARFHGALPTPIHVYLVPVPLLFRGGVFGTVLRRAAASIVLFFGEHGSNAGLRGDWVAVHEIFHAGIPHVRGRPPWFVEGFTTYYQDVLRARSGAKSAAAMWEDLTDGNRRFCQPARARSLRTESRELRATHAYQRVYWGGACVALILDAALRKKGASLDAVLRAMFAQSRLAPLDEQEVVAWLDREAGDGLATRLLDETKAIALAPELESVWAAITSAK